MRRVDIPELVAERVCHQHLERAGNAHVWHNLHTLDMRCKPAVSWQRHIREDPRLCQRKHSRASEVCYIGLVSAFVRNLLFRTYLALPQPFFQGTTRNFRRAHHTSQRMMTNVTTSATEIDLCYSSTSTFTVAIERDGCVAYKVCMHHIDAQIKWS